jgi:thioredoxin-like negative regulator of GroEL
MTKLLLISIFVSFGLTGFAADAPKMKSADAITTNSSQTSFVGELKQGFHFNDKAPNAVVVDGKEIKPKTISARKIEFPLPTKFSEGKASLYVCDDAVTVCEIHHVDLKGNSTAKPTAEAKTLPKGKLVHGFIQDDLQTAIKMAAEKKQLVMIDFSARWCPGCVRYEKEIFPTKEFAQLTKDFVKVKIDVDKFENNATSEKYKIVGIPTLVIINGDEAEVDRLVDFVPMEKLKPFINSVMADPTPMAQLLLQKDTKDPAMRLKIGKKLFASGQYGASLDFLGTINPPPPEFQYARILQAEENFKKDEKTKDKYIEVLRSAIAADGESSRALGWRKELADLLGENSETKKIAEEGIKIANDLLNDPAKLKKAVETDYVGDFLGNEKLFVAIYKADLESILKPKSPEPWEEAAKIGEASHISPDKTAPAMRYLSVLRQAKRYANAEKWVNKIIAHDPKNEDLKRRKMEILNSQEKFKDAANLGEKIINDAVGRNQFWVAEGLAKAYIGMKQKDSAKKVLTAYLSRPEIQTDEMKSSRKKMEDLLKTLN